MTDVAARLGAALADRYVIERELGAGGMATVYLAHDVRHDRKVALKVLRPELAAILGGARFLHEIKTTANLQHPHILGLFDSGEADGTVFYVMPYVDGESLRDRLTREKQLPVDDAVRLAKEVADALEYAHQHGIVHRDIKPENVLLHGGHAMVADFGIALAASRSDGATRMTETGMSLGTPAYMAPEQAMGERDITPRADIYALGAMLYEMLSGEPPFVGPSAQAIIARVLTEEPRSLTLQRHTILPHVEAVVRKALEKLPADRFATAAEFAHALVHPEATTSRAVGTAGAVRRAPDAARGRILHVASLIAILIVGFGSGTAVMKWRSSPNAADEAVVRFEMDADAQWLTISPDGSAIAWVKPASTAAQRVIYVRRTSQGDILPVAGAQGGWMPSFSTDGQALVFVRGDSLYRVETGSGRLLLLAHGSIGRPSWERDGFVYFGSGGGIMRVPAAGGSKEEVVPAPDSAGQSLIYVGPRLLPGGRTLLLTAYRSDTRRADVLLADVGSRQVRTLIDSATDAHYLPTGHLLYSGSDGTLRAAPFNVRTLKITGTPGTVLSSLQVNFSRWSEFAVSNRGTAVYRLSRGGASSLFLVDQRGATQRLPVAGGDIRAVRFSSDGRRIVYGLDGRLLVFDIPLGTTTRLLPESWSGGFDPLWSDHDRTITFHSTLPGRTLGWDGFTVSAEGGATPRQLFRDSVLVAPLDWLPDGRLLARGEAVGRGSDLWVVAFAGDSVVKTPYLRAEWDEWNAQVAPNGRWIAYVSDESGRSEVYVRPFPDAAGGKWRISERGGNDPRWAPDGRGLYYWADSTLQLARLRTAPGFAVLRRDTVRVDPDYYPSCCAPNYDFDPSGRMVMARHAPEPQADRVVVAVNWFTELRQRLAGRP